MSRARHAPGGECRREDCCRECPGSGMPRDGNAAGKAAVGKPPELSLRPGPGMSRDGNAAGKAAVGKPSGLSLRPGSGMSRDGEYGKCPLRGTQLSDSTEMPAGTAFLTHS